MKVREMLTPLAATVSKNRKEKKRNNDTLTNVILKKKNSSDGENTNRLQIVFFQFSWRGKEST